MIVLAGQEADVAGLQRFVLGGKTESSHARTQVKENVLLQMPMLDCNTEDPLVLTAHSPISMEACAILIAAREATASESMAHSEVAKRQYSLSFFGLNAG